MCMILHIRLTMTFQALLSLCCNTMQGSNMYVKLSFYVCLTDVSVRRRMTRSRETCGYSLRNVPSSAWRAPGRRRRVHKVRTTTHQHDSIVSAPCLSMNRYHFNVVLLIALEC